MQVRKLNYQEAIFFEALTKDRIESAMMLEKPSMRGIKNSVVEKYSDQAHFIYELLQNADDAKATKARFILESNRLIFAHNGSRHFSVTDPEKEEEDSLSGNLGDINAITAIPILIKLRHRLGSLGLDLRLYFSILLRHIFMIQIFALKSVVLLSQFYWKKIFQEEDQKKLYLFSLLIIQKDQKMRLIKILQIS